MFKAKIERVDDASSPRSSKSQKKKGTVQAHMVNGMNMLVTDSHEPSEPIMYLFKVDTAPRRLKRRLLSNLDANKCNYDFVYFADLAEGTDGLVVEEDEYDEGDVYDEAENWLARMCIEQNRFRAPFSGRIDFCVVLISA